jgi:dihydroflavonol-4-reductase
MYKQTSKGLVNVLEAAAAAASERLVYTSSVAVLGIHRDRRPADETTPVTLDDMIGTIQALEVPAEQAVHRRLGELDYPVVNREPTRRRSAPATSNPLRRGA